MKKIVDIWWISFQKTLDRPPQMSGLEIGHLWHRKTRLTLTCRFAPPSSTRRGRRMSGGVAQTDVGCFPLPKQLADLSRIDEVSP